MTLVQVRDVAIILMAVFGALLSLVLLVVSIMIYRKVSLLMDTTRVTLDNIRGTSAFMSETVVKPVIRLASFSAGVKGAIKFLLGLKRRKGG